MISNDDIFICKECGECCKGYGGTHVYEKDIKNIAGFIKVDIDEFIDKFCVISGERYVLAQKKDGFCIFSDKKLCSIHPVKPKMCKDWPFIQNVVRIPSSWLVMAEACAGINKDVPLDEVVKYIKMFNSEADI